MYSVRYNRRVKGLRLAVYRDGRVIVTVRSRWYRPFVDDFVRAKMAWIIKKLRHFKSLPTVAPIKRSQAELQKLFLDSRRLVMARLAHFNRVYNYPYRRVTIRNQRTRWGSCSRQGNMNFNYRIALLPEELADYIVVHEVFHLVFLIHSHLFWQLVSQTIPDYRERRKKIRNVGLHI